MTESYIFTYVTVAHKKEAHEIARILIDKSLAACVNISSQVSSYYKWQGKVCKDEEYVLFIKSLESFFDEIKKIILRHHSYDLPCIIKIPCTGGYQPYLEWVRSQVQKD